MKRFLFASTLFVFILTASMPKVQADDPAPALLTPEEMLKKKDIEKDPAAAILKMQPDIDANKVKGDSAWMMMSTALVLLMVPGLALFYGGMVRRKNILATMMQSMVALAVVGVYWIVIGYALAFGDPWLKTPWGGSVLGFSSELVLLRGVNPTALLPNTTIPVYLHMLFQGMFAIITPALISGAVAERIRFKPYCIFLILWVTFVYCPLAHSVWAMDFDWAHTLQTDPARRVNAAIPRPGDKPVGVLSKMNALDFAGGTVVHIAAGFSALAAILLLRKRIGYPEHAMHPNSMVLTLTGAGLLWFGWFGFNGGSGLVSGELAVCAFAASQAAAAAAGLSWMFVEWLHRGKPTALGLASGIVAGLVAVTPASGYIFPWAGLAIGLIAGIVCYLAVALKPVFKYDDSLDAFGVHGVGGFLGAVLTGVFCTRDIPNSASQNGLLLGSHLEGAGIDAAANAANPGQVMVQLLAALASAVLAFVLSMVIIKILDLLMGFSPAPNEEIDGLDRSEHGETGFDFGAGMDTAVIKDDFEPRQASVPPVHGKRFQVVLEGPSSADLIQAWSDLCQPSKDIPLEFKTVYPFVTTVMGNRFQFRGGDPALMRQSLQQLLEKRLNKPLHAKVEVANGSTGH